jgi:hypothetical protein
LAERRRSVIKTEAPVKASIIVNNYNYGPFLRDAIDSALRQSYPNVEVIVVDDGSTDDSREIIARYRDRIIPVLKENGGQASAFNAGFAKSHGEVIFFLDSDDMLLGTAVESALPLFRNPRTVKVHWPLWKIDKHGVKTGEIIPKEALAEGDLRELVIREGPASHRNPPTSGNAWARLFLESVFPIPELEFRLCVDTYLLELAPLFGELGRILEPQGFYRIHGENRFASTRFEEMLRIELALYRHLLPVMSRFCCDMGLGADLERLKQKTWCNRLERAIREIAEQVPPGHNFILVDQDEWGMSEARNPPVPFLERDGKYWGRPPDDETAIRELERLRGAGASFIVFGWPAFWWLDDYQVFDDYLRSHYLCVLENERLVVFNLHRKPHGGSVADPTRSFKVRSG